MFRVPNGYLWVATNHQVKTKNFFISNLSKTINAFPTKYDIILLMCDFNLKTENKLFEKLVNLFNLKSFISSPTCFQSTNTTCIDLILTNQEDLFSNSNTCEVGISNHRHLVSTILNKKILKDNTKTLFYRDYKKFKENNCAKDLAHELQKIRNPSYSQFEKAFVKVLDNHVPPKRNG